MAFPTAVVSFNTQLTTTGPFSPASAWRMSEVNRALMPRCTLELLDGYYTPIVKLILLPQRQNDIYENEVERYNKSAKCAFIRRQFYNDDSEMAQYAVAASS